MTIAQGTNVLLGEDAGAIPGIALRSGAPEPCSIALWDGRAGERMADALLERFGSEIAEAVRA